jgi:hypothetical protein
MSKVKAKKKKKERFQFFSWELAKTLFRSVYDKTDSDDDDDDDDK